MSQPVIKVINGHQEGWSSGVYCGRANMLLGLPQSPLASPYQIGTDGDRDQCHDMYMSWLRRKFKDCSIVRSELERLKNIAINTGKLTLISDSAPERCHCDSIKDAIHGMLQQSGAITRKPGSKLPAFKLKATVTGAKGRVSDSWHGVVVGIKRIRKDEAGDWIFYFQVNFYERYSHSEKVISKNPVIGMLTEHMASADWNTNELDYVKGKWINKQSS